MILKALPVLCSRFIPAIEVNRLVKFFVGFLVVLGSLPLAAQDRDLSAAAPNIGQKIGAPSKGTRKVLAISSFTNDEGLGPSFGDYLAESLTTLLSPGAVGNSSRLFDVVTRAHLEEVRQERKLGTAIEFDRKSFEQLGRFAGATVVLVGSYSVQGTDVRVNWQCVDISSGVIQSADIFLIANTAQTQRLLKPVQTDESRAQSSSVAVTAGPGRENLAPITPVQQKLFETAEAIGLNTIETGGYTREEDQRLRDNIRSAKSIKILVPNGSSLTLNFRKDFEAFLAKPEASMRVLFATADSVFYREETEMTNLQLEAKGAEEDAKINQGLVELGRHRLVSYARTPDQVEVKFFDTQFRMPIIIIDDRYCYLTLRLSPNESPESVRLEFEGGKNAFANACVAHFNRMWQVSAPTVKGK